MAVKLTTIMRRCLSRYRFFDTDEPVVLAVSTGVDSMCLLAVAEEVLPASRLVVAHINHHLRQQSQEEEAFLKDYCQQRGLRLYVDQWEQHPAQGIEAAARQERYRFFKQVMDQVDSRTLLLAHQRDELSENIMMQLLRGGRLEQLVGMPEARTFNQHGCLIRPWLTVAKADLVAYARQHQLRWYEDASNQEDDTLRNRFRHHYLPALIAENPRFEDHLLAYRQQLLESQAALDDLLSPLLAEACPQQELDLSVYRRQSTLVRHQLLKAWLAQRQVFNLADGRITQIDHWLQNGQSPTGRRFLVDQYFLKKGYQRAKIKKVDAAATPPFPCQENVVESELILNQWQVTHHGHQYGVFDHQLAAGRQWAYMLLPASCLPLVWQRAQAGGRLRLKNGGHQSVRRLMINAKLPHAERDSWPILADQSGRVLWVPGLKTAWLPRPTTDERTIKVYLYERTKLEGRHE